MIPENYLKIINLEEVDSTNTYALTLAAKGEKEITVIRASNQTNGRGRLGRKWICAKNKGLYLSFILQPQRSLEELKYLPLVLAFAVLKSIKDRVGAGGSVPLLKWPNDVFVSGKKIAGVLVETRSDSKGIDFVVAGIGLNVNNDQGEVPEEATSLYLECGKIYELEGIFKSLLKQVLSLYKDFNNGKLEAILKDINNVGRTLRVPV